MAWQTEGGDLTHRGTPRRRCQAVRSERGREKTPLIPQMESLGATLVRLLVTPQSQPGPRMDGLGEETDGVFGSDTHLVLECEFEMR